MITARTMGSGECNGLPPREAENNDIEEASNEKPKKDDKKGDHESTTRLPGRLGRSGNLRVLPDRVQHRFAYQLHDLGRHPWRKQ